MLPKIATEALHFPTRRDLDKVCGVSKWLDKLIAQTCETYPLRAVDCVKLHRCGDDFILNVSTIVAKYARTRYLFATMDEAVRFLGRIFRHSYIERLEVNFN